MELILYIQLTTTKNNLNMKKYVEKNGYFTTILQVNKVSNYRSSFLRLPPLIVSIVRNFYQKAIWC